MKSIKTDEGGSGTAGNSGIGRACLKTCKGIISQVGKAKGAIFAETRGMLNIQDQLLRLALNEAEALAWQTSYPQLVFPTLAVEKIQGVAAWNSRQLLVSGSPISGISKE